jgi:hypothetical protein
MATNGGNRLKGTNVIAQQADKKKKYVFRYLSVNSCRRRRCSCASPSGDYQTNTHTDESHIPSLFTRTTSAVQIDDVIIFPHRAAI